MVLSIALSSRRGGWQVVDLGGTQVRHREVWGEEVAISREGVQSNCVSTDDVQETGRYEETNSGPVIIAMIKASLVLTEGIGLDIGVYIPFQHHLCNFPGDDIPDASMGLKTMEYNGITTKEYLILPDTRVCGDVKLDACLDFLLLDILDRRVMDPATPTIVPAPLESLVIEDTCRYLVSVGVIDGVGTMPLLVSGRESVTALMESGGRGARGGWDIVVGRGGEVSATRRCARIRGVGHGGGVIRSSRGQKPCHRCRGRWYKGGGG